MKQPEPSGPIRGAGVARHKAQRKRDDAVHCEACGWTPPSSIRNPAGLMHCHHVVPIACGGPDIAENIIMLCPNCHALAHRLGKSSPRPGWAFMAWTGATTRNQLIAQLLKLMDTKSATPARNSIT